MKEKKSKVSKSLSIYETDWVSIALKAKEKGMSASEYIVETMLRAVKRK